MGAARECRGCLMFNGQQKGLPEIWVRMQGPTFEKNSLSHHVLQEGPFSRRFIHKASTHNIISAHETRISKHPSYLGTELRGSRGLNPILGTCLRFRP